MLTFGEFGGVISEIKSVASELKTISSEVKSVAREFNELSIELRSVDQALSRGLSAKLLQGEPNTHVYLGMRNGEPVYVGITKDIAARQAQHEAKGSFLKG